MTHAYQISCMTCSGCASTVENALRNVVGVESVKVDLQQSRATITMNYHIPVETLKTGLAAFPLYQLSENGSRNIVSKKILPGFCLMAM